MSCQRHDRQSQRLMSWPSHRGPLAVVLWQAAYRLAEWFGIQQGPYIGIGVNIAFMAATGVAAMRMSILVFGATPSTCGD